MRLLIQGRSRLLFGMAKDGLDRGLAVAASGEIDKEGGAVSYGAFHADEAAVFGDDLVGDGQAEARAFVLGGEERVEDVVETFLGNADAGVPNLDLSEGEAPA